MGEKSEMLTAVYKTVDSFSGILGKKLTLLNMERTGTADYFVFAPFEDPCFYQRVEHGIAHITFGSSAQTRDVFAFSYAKAVAEQVQHRSGDVISEKALREGITYLFGLLEEERVLSLWQQLYVGSERLIRDYRGMETSHLVDDCKYNILHYATVIAAQHSPLDGGELSWFEAVFRRALARVRLGTFQTTLVVTKQLVLEIVDALVELARHETGAGDGEAAFDERAAALGQLCTAMSSPPESQEGKINGFHTPNHMPEDSESEAQAQAIDAINTPPEATEARLAEERNVMAANLDDIKERVSRAFQENRGVTTDVKARVSIVDVAAEDTMLHKFSKLTPEDLANAHRMRALFYRVMGRRRQVLEDFGAEPDLLAALQRRVSHRNTPVYRMDAQGRGFKAMLLIDRSGSMADEKTQQCDRARKIIQKALDFPFVSIHVWGFSGITDGSVRITRFNTDVPSLDVKGYLSPIKGSTPIHAALHVARRHMEEGAEKKHIFLITDGAPVFWRWDRSPVSAVALRKWVRREVNSARRAGIGVTTLIIEGPWGLAEGLNSVTLGKMFGPAHSWQVLKEGDRFGKELSDTVVESFSRYLKHG